MGRQQKCITFLEIYFRIWKLRRLKLIWKYKLKLFLVKWILCYFMNWSQRYLTFLYHVSFQWDNETELPSIYNLIRVPVIKTKCLPVYRPTLLKKCLPLGSPTSEFSLEPIHNNSSTTKSSRFTTIGKWRLLRICWRYINHLWRKSHRRGEHDKGRQHHQSKLVVTTDKENNKEIIILELTLHGKDVKFEFSSYENGKQLPPHKQFIIFHGIGYKIIGLFFQ
jgi:hypothetical protein